ncbi:MAG TPA: extracellular solute-binding protein [Clostridiales bacterium]|nr:extracellular solute-binding protein [Clostridiales bacterium]
MKHIYIYRYIYKHIYKNIYKNLCFLIAVILLITLVPADSQAEPDLNLKLSEKFKTNKTTTNSNNNSDNNAESGIYSGVLIDKENSYFDIQEEYKEKGYRPASDIEIFLDMQSITSNSDENAPILGEVAGKKDVLVWEEDKEYFEWTAEIPQDGLYEVLVIYYPLGGTSNTIQRSIMIDGEIPFLEAYNIYFNRIWRDREEPKVNNVGDEVRPRQIEEKIWQSAILTDHQGMYSEPFKFYFTKGAHKIRLIYVDEAIAISDIVVRTPGRIPSYDEVLDEYNQKGYKDASQTFRFEAESNVVRKSDPTIRRESDNDPITYPASATNRKLNIMGGWRWKTGNQSITWKFSVPEDGLYKIGMRIGQWYGDGLPVYRQVAIDGKVPFDELKEYKFQYNKNWEINVLGDSNEGAYLFYLEEGEHELTMTVKMGTLRGIIDSIYEDSLLLSKVIRQIIMLTGSEPDINFEYDLDKNIPDLLENLTKLSVNMQGKAELLNKISTKSPAMANNFLMISDQMEKMVKKPETIPLKLNDLNNALNNLGIWILSLQDHPLAIDYFIAGPSDEKLENKKANILQKLAATWQNFIISFTKDYDNIGSVYNDQIETNEVIDVWVARGREWAEIIKEMADESFTPNTGISVKINVIPSVDTLNALLLSICSGKAPDVACSVQSNYPFEYAVRDAVVDLTQFDDFKQVSGHFLPKIMIPFQYNGGVYALPETMNFKALFYRKDIIEELGIEIPDTWDELYQHVLPVLYQYGMQFHYPSTDFGPLLFQKGGEFYKDEGKKSALDSSEAYQAFREFTELFTNYGIPISANFFNRIRQGEMPMGIGDYYTYVQLSVAAPELSGRWDIAPLPGHITEDGEINRFTDGIAESADIIMNQSDKKKESWEFLKWWTSDETQAKFGSELEALMGAQARWNTANTAAFTNLPWNKQHLKVIQKQWEWATEAPSVLGGYFTQRHTKNAWNRVVIGGMNVRDSMELAVKDINRELRNKQVEYGFIDE